MNRVSLEIAGLKWENETQKQYYNTLYFLGFSGQTF